MIEHASFAVADGGVRLDAALLSSFPSSTRAFAREAIAAGRVKVNGRVATEKGRKLQRGDTVDVEALAEAADNTVAPNPHIRPVCVFEDADVLAFDKPAGMPVQPLTRLETDTLMNGVAAAYPECIPLGDRPLMAGAVHRIDADTSGLVIVARNAAAFERLRSQFAEQKVEKTYLALVEGTFTAGNTLENDLVHDPTVPFCRMVDARRFRECPEKPLHAATEFRPIGGVSRPCGRFTLLEVKIRTGVTHQIRAQLALAGMHIANDRLYGACAEEGMAGHALHALSARLAHPASGVEMVLSTPLPEWAGRLA